MNDRATPNRPGWGLSKVLWLALAVLLLVVAVLTSLQVLAARSRDEFQAELAAAGVKLDWPSIVPPMPPDDENFYATPIARSWLPAKGAGPRGPDEISAPTIPPGWLIQDLLSMSDLSELPRVGAEGRTLEALGLWYDRWNAEFAQFREAARRPFAQLPGDYSSPEILPIQNFVKARLLAQILACRARVHLLQGRSDLALVDLDMLAILIRVLEARPVCLVNSMMRVAYAGLYVDVVKDGFSHLLWREPDLSSLRARLEGMELIPNFLRSIWEGEMAGNCHLLSKFADGNHAARRRLVSMVDGSHSWQAEAMAFIPAISVRKNQLLLAQLLHRSLRAFEPDGSRFYPERSRAAMADANAEFSRTRLRNIFVGWFLPNSDRAAITCARVQTRIGEAIIVCALEKFRAAHGAYPEALAEMGGTLPHDLVSGQSMIYRRPAAGLFVLYCVGPNGKDDSGSGDDWVW